MEIVWIAAAALVFQSPSLRGSGRFGADLAEARSDAVQVSIPFIAGQWSLPAEWRMGDAGGFPRFNPLHCGAVVASPGPAGRGGRLRRRFNPLHCGAVVASRDRQDVRTYSSLLTFQSPSLRGSGRFWLTRLP